MPTARFDDFRAFEPNEKGDLGESIAETYLQNHLIESPETLFSVFDSGSRTRIIGRRTSRLFSFTAVSTDGTTEKYRWSVDSHFRVEHLSNEYTILLETKTGPTADLERGQLETMKHLSKNEDYRVFLCNVIFESDCVDLDYKEMVQLDGESVWKEIEFE